MLFAIVLASSLALVSATPLNATEKRQTNPCSIWTPASQMVGDGNPHQDILHKQVSLTDNCGDGTCTVVREDSVSFTIEANIGGAIEWLDGGFSVSKSVTTGEAIECNGEAGQDVCVWKAIPHTAYTVEDGSYNSCTGFSSNGNTHVESSPNTDGGEQFYCVRGGACRNRGDEYWEMGRCAGGPGSC